MDELVVTVTTGRTSSISRHSQTAASHRHLLLSTHLILQAVKNDEERNNNCGVKLLREVFTVNYTISDCRFTDLWVSIRLIEHKLKHLDSFIQLFSCDVNITDLRPDHFDNLSELRVASCHLNEIFSIHFNLFIEPWFARHLCVYNWFI